MEMTKWFDTNYHYIVPEFYRDTRFSLFDEKAVVEYREARDAGIITKPVLPGPVSYLLSGKVKEKGFSVIELLPDLLPVYAELLNKLTAEGARWVQLDEPFLVTELDDPIREA